MTRNRAPLIHTLTLATYEYLYRKLFLLTYVKMPQAFHDIKNNCPSVFLTE